jgi:hypothetical protein
MKRLWVSAIILVSLLIICTLGYAQTRQISLSMTQTISSAKKAANGGNMDNALKLSQKAVNDWRECHKVLCMYMPHAKLEQIDQTLAGLPMLCYFGANDQFAADCDRSITQIGYLNESELPSLENIF